MSKIYYCVWGDKDPKAANSYEPNEAEKEEDFFCEDNGYSQNEIEGIKNLKIGEVYKFEYGNHTAKRIK
jgi:hypothetical protein